MEKTSLLSLARNKGASEIILPQHTEHPYHQRAIHIVRSVEEISKAVANRPFGDLAEQNPPVDEETSVEARRAFMANGVETFLRNKWPMLQREQVGMEINFSIELDPDPNEAMALSKYAEQLSDFGMEVHGQDLIVLYEHFCEVRKIFSKLLSADLLGPHTVLHDSYLPWFLITAPVWYVQAKDGMLFHQNNDADPLPDAFVEFMAKQLGTQRLADWYQLWNRRSRQFSQYRGDIIPPHILHTITEMTPHFDYLVIATPYHSVASVEWADPQWQNLIDPYLLGFSKAVPSATFLLGRWSDTGVFPLGSEMTAHTMEYLRSHHRGIENFGNPYWATVPAGDRHHSREHRHIASMANDALAAYDRNNLFEWLTAGRPILDPITS